MAVSGSDRRRFVMRASSAGWRWLGDWEDHFARLVLFVLLFGGPSILIAWKSHSVAGLLVGLLLATLIVFGEGAFQVWKAEEEVAVAAQAERDDLVAKLKDRPEIRLRHEDVPTIHLGRRPRELPGESFQASATFHNDGVLSDFRAVIVNRSVTGLDDPNPYPSADFPLRWQPPNDEEWQPIVPGANALVEVVRFSPERKLVRFLGPRTMWKGLTVISDDDFVHGVIELQDRRGPRQRWSFSLSVVTGAFALNELDLDE